MNLKEKIRAGETSIGTWLTIPHQSVVEILGTAGFDWITLDLEHASIDFEAAFNLIGHIQGNGMKALVRVSKNEEVVIKKVLDAGADGIIVPMVNSAADVRKLLDYTYYPPLGKRGVGLNRAQNYGLGFQDYQEKLIKEIVVIAQIEHIDAINNLEEILSFEELDGTMIGPYDLSASLNLPGQYDQPIVLEALKKYEQICKQKGKSKGAHVIQSEPSFLIDKLNLG
ncbi:MAG: 2,4-dihydroxyhept-2-ene-1,7-dioic acid aldolase, partial [Bacteroidetes bacterium]|nr:2,4-dihydroxyhept-2-ene-1,7-dioic acid aldolase [Bacteroidota bacterium]